jgi:hypothetical protein
MRYQGYEIRREILMFKGDEHTRALFVLLEHIDWSTGRKEATSWAHMKNWLNQLCSKYNLDMEVMKNAVQAGTERGWFDLTASGSILSLGNKPVLSLIDEAPAPVEIEEKVPYSPYQNRVALTRENIRILTECPKCGADKGLMCFGEKRGRNNREANHKERSQAASRVLREERE